MSELDFVSELLAGSRSRTNSGAYISEFISSGELYREVDLKTGKISTVAGTGKKGYTGDGGNPEAARLSGLNVEQTSLDGAMNFCSRSA